MTTVLNSIDFLISKFQLDELKEYKRYYLKCLKDKDKDKIEKIEIITCHFIEHFLSGKLTLKDIHYIVKSENIKIQKLY